MKKIVSIIIIIGIFNINIAYAGSDLLTDYMSHNSNSVDYRFGINLPNPYNGNNQIVSAGLSSNPNGQCGAFSALTSLTASFNKAALENLGTALLSNVPVLLLCYASQTLCDAYKFARNLANAAASLSTANCQQMEKLAENTGTALGNNSVSNCVQQTTGGTTISAQDYATVVSQCQQQVGSNSPITNFLNIGGNANGYSLSNYMAQTFPNSQLLVNTLSLVSGDIQFSGNGIAHSMVQNGVVQMQNMYAQQYYNATKGVIENAVTSATAPSSSDLQTISIVGFPMTPYFASKLTTLPSQMRESFYEQYATLCGTVATFTNIQSLKQALATAKVNGAVKSVQDDLQGQIDKLKGDMDDLAKQLEFQKSYLAPMIGAVMEYKLPNATAVPTQTDIQPDVPVGIGR